MFLFRFPSDDNLKQQWITKMNRQGWTPTKYTKICSCHFNDADFIVTKKGHKKLKKGTLPILKLDLSVGFDIVCKPSFNYFGRISMYLIYFFILQLKRKLPEPVLSSMEPTTSGLNEFLILHDTPRRKKLKQEIEQLRCREKKSGLNIRRLQMKVKRLKKKVLI